MTENWLRDYRDGEPVFFPPFWKGEPGEDDDSVFLTREQLSRRTTSFVRLLKQELDSTLRFKNPREVAIRMLSKSLGMSTRTIQRRIAKAKL